MHDELNRRLLRRRAGGATSEGTGGEQAGVYRFLLRRRPFIRLIIITARSNHSVHCGKSKATFPVAFFPPPPPTPYVCLFVCLFSAVVCAGSARLLIKKRQVWAAIAKKTRLVMFNLSVAPLFMDSRDPSLYWTAFKPGGVGWGLSVVQCSQIRDKQRKYKTRRVKRSVECVRCEKKKKIARSPWSDWRLVDFSVSSMSRAL